jgi:hypothetical protein
MADIMDKNGCYFSTSPVSSLEMLLKGSVLRRLSGNIFRQRLSKNMFKNA